MADPTRVLLLGKDPTIAAAATDILKPDFEVIQSVSSIPEATSYLSSTSPSDPRPSIILLGAGFSNADYEALRAFTDSANEQFTWMRPAQFRPGATMEMPKGRPTPQQIAARIRKGVDEGGTELKSAQGTGEVFYF